MQLMCGMSGPSLDVHLKHAPSIYITRAGLVCSCDMLAARTLAKLLYDAVAQISQRPVNEWKLYIWATNPVHPSLLEI